MADDRHDLDTTPDSLGETTRLPIDGLLRHAISASVGRARIVVVEGAGVGQMVEVGETPVTIGREHDNTLPLAAVGVSRRHALVQLTREGPIVQDLGSKNGTFVNKQPIKRQKLADGDIIFIGAATLKYLGPDSREHNFLSYVQEVGARDALTGVANRRVFDERIEHELARARRAHTGLSLLLVDVDHFKAINDNHGHLAGDEILRALGAVLSRCARESDLVARYGGEEFALVLPKTGRGGAETVAEEVRASVERHRFEYSGQVLPVTVSVGGAQLSAEMGEPSELIAAADERLYLAKQNGRNRVEIA